MRGSVLTKKVGAFPSGEGGRWMEMWINRLWEEVEGH